MRALLPQGPCRASLALPSPPRRLAWPLQSTTWEPALPPPPELFWLKF